MSTNAVTISAPEGVPFIDIEREFDAPVEALYRAHIDPGQVAQWLGPHGYEMTLDRYEARTGGSYRYIHRHNGEEYAFNGVFHVARPNELIIQTFEFEGYPDVVSIETLRFHDLGNGRSKVVNHSTFPTQEARDGIIENGMELGVREGYERLDALLG